MEQQLLTPEQQNEFKQRIQQLYDMTEDIEYVVENAGNILARVMTNDEAEWVEDINDYGYDYDIDEFDQIAAQLTTTVLDK
jgi:hypothetical protein